MANTVRLHRVLATKPEKVYRAFIEADALAKWLPPNGFACTVHQLNAKVGGTFRMSFRNFTTGNNHSFGGEYIELVPHERLRYVARSSFRGVRYYERAVVRRRPCTRLRLALTTASNARDRAATRRRLLSGGSVSA